MQLPFSAEQFFEVFSAYNTAVWPAQVLLVATAVGAIVAVARNRPSSGAVVSAILAMQWAWVGGVYHLAFFTGINKLAYAFGALSLVGAALFLWYGVVRRRLRFGLSRRPMSGVGGALVLYAVVVYPAWTSLSGHHYPAFPTFGLPCPTTLFTLGMLALLEPPYPRAPVVVPVLWCLVGAQAAFLLGVQADLALIAAALVGITLLVQARRPALPAAA